MGQSSLAILKVVRKKEVVLAAYVSRQQQGWYCLLTHAAVTYYAHPPMLARNNPQLLQVCRVQPCAQQQTDTLSRASAQLRATAMDRQHQRADETRVDAGDTGTERKLGQQPNQAMVAAHASA